MKCIISCLIAVFLFGSSAVAADNEIFDRQYDSLNVSELEDSVPEMAKERFLVTRDISFDDGLKKLKNRLLNEFKGVLSSGIKSAAAVLVIAALCGIVKSFFEAGSAGGVPGYVFIAGALSITAACTGSLNTIIGMGKSAVDEINTFSKALLPTLSVAAAASGAPLSSAAKYAATALFSDVLITTIHSLFFPLVYAYIAVSAADASLENSALGKIADFIKWIMTSGLKIALTVYIAYLSVSGILASSADNLSVKTARFAINGIVPIVGSVIADAAGTVVAGAAIMKNTIGVFGMLTVLSICLTPFLTLAVNYFLFKLSAVVIAPMVENRLSRLVENIGNSFGLVLGMSAASALLVFLSIISSMYVTGVV